MTELTNDAVSILNIMYRKIAIRDPASYSKTYAVRKYRLNNTNDGWQESSFVKSIT